jgi:hypothetical protein
MHVNALYSRKEELAQFRGTASDIAAHCLAPRLGILGRQADANADPDTQASITWMFRGLEERKAHAARSHAASFVVSQASGGGTFATAGRRWMPRLLGLTGKPTD